jgi:Fic-DOC domain mobile mystery protein B
MSELFDAAQDADGATPLTDGAASELIPTWVTTRGQLDAVERDNILKARRSHLKRRVGTAVILDELFVRRLHRQMFGDVWTWAGTYRLTEVNIGIDPSQIASAVTNLVANCALWLTSASDPMEPDEAAVRVHHGMVAIHPFPNGNGRHAREYVDLLLRSRGRQPFTWGSENLVAGTELRKTYLNALKVADKGDFGPLRAFVRS